MAEYNVCTFIPHYFDDLLELVHYSLLELGHESVISHNALDNTKINIVFGAHASIGLLDYLPSDTIIFNTEQLDVNSEYPHIRDWTHILLVLGQRFTVWDYNKKNIAIWKDHGVVAKLFEFGYQNSLNRIVSQADKPIDVLFYGGVNEHRRFILDSLRERSVKVVELPAGLFGKERDAFIAQTKLVINMHLYSTEIFEIVRCSYLMNNGIPIVSEVNETTTIDPFYLDGIASAPYEGLVDKCIELLNDDVKRQEQGYKGLATLSQRPQFMLLKDVL